MVVEKTIRELRNMFALYNTGPNRQAMAVAVRDTLRILGGEVVAVVPIGTKALQKATVLQGGQKPIKSDRQLELWKWPATRNT